MFKKLTNIAASLAIVLSIVAPASAASVTLTSKVANVTKGSVWANQTTASAGDSLSYLMTLRNETGSPVTNLMARVQLPAEISYVSGSAIFVYRDASGKDVTTAVADGLVSGNGVTLPNIPALNQIYVAYKAKVNSGFTSGTWFAPSNQIKADGFSLSSNDARVTLSGQDPQPQPTVSAQLDTYLYNLTKNVRTYTQSVEAERGDELIYRVTIRNTGNTTLTNTGFKVEIPAGLEFVDGYSRFYYGDGFENIGLSANIVSAGGVALMDIPAQTYRYV
ncbi:hypothetical protein HYV44_03890, partial [Candidatus Microgenomates bacterium]|nr:hypothetical protein [Candidatus Microgenomates bacterium]